MFNISIDLELYDPIKNLDKKTKVKFITEQEKVLKEVFSLFNENNVKISCFVTNEFVDNFFDFFHKYIVEKHEVGCHTSNHIFYNGNNIEVFAKDIKKNKTFLEKETGLKCQGFRAPGGVVPKNLASVLKKIYLKYDSSVIPGFVPGRFNQSSSPRTPYFPDFDKETT